MLASVSTPPSDPVARELAALRAELSQLLADNRVLRERLDLSEQARRDLAAQTEHLLHLLGESRRELRHLRELQPKAR